MAPAMVIAGWPPWRRGDFTSRIARHGHRSGPWRRPGWRGPPPGFSPLDRPSKRAPLKIFSPLDRPSKEVQNFYRKFAFRRPHGSRKRCDFCKSLILLVSLEWRRWEERPGSQAGRGFHGYRSRLDDGGAARPGVMQNAKIKYFWFKVLHSFRVHIMVIEPGGVTRTTNQHKRG